MAGTKLSNLPAATSVNPDTDQVPVIQGGLNVRSTITMLVAGIVSLLVPRTMLGAASGVATLDSGSKLTAGQIPTSVSTGISNAQSTADGAASNASTALSTASTAASNASSALSTANSAATAASNAQSTANAAQSTANAALPASQKGAANGVAPLGADSIVPAVNLPNGGAGAINSYNGRTGTVVSQASDSGRTGVVAMVRPLLSAFNYVYGALAAFPAGAMSFTDAGDSYVLSVTNQLKSGSTTGTLLNVGYFKPITPGTNVLTGCFEFDVLNTPANFAAGIATLNSAGGTAGQGGLMNGVGIWNTSLSVISSVSPNANNTDAFGTTPGFGAGVGRIWLRITGLASGTSSRTVFMSSNGRDWNPVATYVTSLNAANITHVGFVMKNDLSAVTWSGGPTAGTNPWNARLLHFVES